MELNRRAQNTIKALREPDHAFATVPNTVRQSVADVVSDLQKAEDIYGVALTRIREGAMDPQAVATSALAQVRALKVSL